jgi:hypothetical protein
MSGFKEPIASLSLSLKYISEGPGELLFFLKGPTSDLRSSSKQVRVLWVKFEIHKSRGLTCQLTLVENTTKDPAIKLSTDFGRVYKAKETNNLEGILCMWIACNECVLWIVGYS